MVAEAYGLRTKWVYSAPAGQEVVGELRATSQALGRVGPALAPTDVGVSVGSIRFAGSEPVGCGWHAGP